MFEKWKQRRRDRREAKKQALLLNEKVKLNVQRFSEEFTYQLLQELNRIDRESIWREYDEKHRVNLIFDKITEISNTAIFYALIETAKLVKR